MEKINLTRSLIETTVDKTLREIRNDPGRSIRKLLDLAQSVSRGRFQKRFFEIAQRMMEDENSAYYEMVTNLVTFADLEKIKTFGVNLGYNGCTLGAKRIRENEAKWHFDIPWNIFLGIGNGKAAPQDVDRLISQGTELGVYVYLLYSSHALNDEYHAILEKYGDCAFILLTQPDEVLDAVVNKYGGLANCMFIVDADARHIQEATAELRSDGFLYGTYRRYDEDAADALLSHAALSQSAQYGGTFLLLLPTSPCLTANSEAIGQRVSQIREEQRYPFLPMDIRLDSLRIDRVISNSPCSVGFDAMGQVYTAKGKWDGPGGNYLQTDLRAILARANARAAL